MSNYYKIILSCGLIIAFTCPIFAQTANDRDARRIIKIKNKVAEINTEPRRKIKVTLETGTKIKGYITEIRDDHFSVLDSKSGKLTQIEYSQVSEAERDGISRLAKSLIVGGITMGAIFIPIFIALATARD